MTKPVEVTTGEEWVMKWLTNDLYDPNLAYVRAERALARFGITGEAAEAVTDAVLLAAAPTLLALVTETYADMCSLRLHEVETMGLDFEVALGMRRGLEDAREQIRKLGADMIRQAEEERAEEYGEELAR